DPVLPVFHDRAQVDASTRVRRHQDDHGLSFPSAGGARSPMRSLSPTWLPLQGAQPVTTIDENGLSGVTISVAKARSSTAFSRGVSALVRSHRISVVAMQSAHHVGRSRCMNASASRGKKPFPSQVAQFQRNGVRVTITFPSYVTEVRANIRSSLKPSASRWSLIRSSSFRALSASIAHPLSEEASLPQRRG